MINVSTGCAKVPCTPKPYPKLMKYKATHCVYLMLSASHGAPILPMGSSVATGYTSSETNGWEDYNEQLTLQNA